MSTEPRPADSDSTDWTFVITDGCRQCGYVPHDVTETARRLADLPGRWSKALERPNATIRPQEGIWSPVEYGCHSRDLIEVLGERIELILGGDRPTFANYDGEAEVVSGRFWEADPAELAQQIASETERTISIYQRVTEGDWDRKGLRGDGKAMTIADLSRYLLHDLEHHLVDVDG